MIADPRKFFGGVILLAAFAVVLAALFMPIIDGLNAMEQLDALYNSISKGSADYIPALEEEVAPHEGSAFTVSLAMKDADLAGATAALFEQAGATVETVGTEVRVSGDLARTLRSCLTDTKQVFANNGDGVESKYGLEPKEALFAWFADFGPDELPEWLHPAAGIYAMGISWDEPVEALEWALLVPDEENRDLAMLTIARRWRELDPEGAEAWLRESPLSEEQRAKARIFPDAYRGRESGIELNRKRRAATP